MKKKLIAVFITFVAITLMPIAASASSYGFKQGDYVELNGYRFIVLDPATNYLFYDGYLENRKFSTNSTINIFNPNDPSNLGYYLNQTFLGNLGSLSSFIANKEWQIKDLYDGKITKVNTRIGLLSLEEWQKYSPKILPNPSFIFWSITPYTKKISNKSVICITQEGGSGVCSPDNTGNSVRPSLYLMPDLYIKGAGTRSNPYILTTEEIVILSDIKNLSLVNTTQSEITLTWKNPSESNFSHVNIYEGGNIEKNNFTNETYTFEGLNPSQEYKFTIKAVDLEGKETEGISIVVSTNDVPLVPEINNLKATTKSDRVNLSWSNPQSEFFNHVKIYRKVDEQASTNETSLLNIFQPLTVRAAEEEFNPMFETNGTYWNDLTVEPATTYSYKLTTVNIADAESEGTIVQATTLGEPPPKIEGGGYEENENGDFLFTWTSPTTGQVKVLIDGTQYKTVDASLKQILIPKEDMKYDIFNNPKVTLVPITEDGKEGTPTKPGEGGGSGGIGGGKLPFGPVDLLTSSMGLLGLIAPILLLSMTIIFFRPIKNVIVKAVQTHRERKMQR